MVRTVSDAIVYPHQDSALGLAGAASHHATVFSVADLDAETLLDPRARLGMRLHDPGREPDMFGFGGREAVTACYMVEFNYYKATSISRVPCPARATALKFPPAPPKIRIPEEMAVIVKGVLEALPARPVADDVRCEISGRMPELPRNDGTGLQDLPPPVEVIVEGRDVGVALREPDTGSCLLGARLDGEANAWYASSLVVRPGELPCDPETALLPSGTRSPH